MRHTVTASEAAQRGRTTPPPDRRRTGLRNGASLRALAAACALGAAIAATQPVIAADDVFSDPAAFQDRLTDIVVNGDGDSTLTYDGPVGELRIVADTATPGQNASLTINLAPSEIYIDQAEFIIGPNTVVNVAPGGGVGDILVGDSKSWGVLTVDGGVLNVSEPARPQTSRPTPWPLAIWGGAREP
ncbi:hypothetical protein ACFFJB_00910 [Camelimonas abortus]|uniref:Uncharacterized protein n=1 Tax=Camelimonas abortus TaxID=1017184 RepID=A0ABV7LB11_9HYPH